MALTRDEIDQLRKEYTPDLPLELALSVYQQESGSGKTNATSNKGAAGGFQVTRVAAEDVGADFSRVQKEDYYNAVTGMRYLDKQYKAAGGDVFGAAARYFGGPNAMQNLSITDGRVSRGDYATQVAQRYRSLRGETGMAESTPSAAQPKLQNADYLQAQLESAFGISQAANNAASDQITRAASTSAEDTNRMVQSTTEIGSLLSDVSMDLRKQQLAKAGAAARNAATVGLAVDDLNSLFATVTADYMKEVDQAIAIKESVRAKGDIGFLDDPLNFLQAHLVEIPYLTKLHNQTVDIAVDKYNKLDSINNALQKKNVIDAAQIADISLEGAAAEARVAALKAGVEAAKLSQAGAVQLAQLSVNKAAIENKTLNEVQQLEDQRLKKIQREYAQLLLEGKLEELAEKKEAKELLDKDLATLGWTYNAFKATNKATQTALATVMRTGRLGNDPVEAMHNTNLIPNLKMKPEQAQMINEFRRIVEANGVMTDHAFPKPEDKVSRSNAVIRDEFKKYSADPNYNKQYNPYTAPSPAVMMKLMEGSPEISETFKKTISTIAGTVGTNQLDDIVIVESAVKQIGQNGYTREAAIADISKYYTAAVGFNNKQKSFLDFGLPVQEKYPISTARVHGVAPLTDISDAERKAINTQTLVFGTRITADLANPTAVSGLVTLLQARKMRTEAGNQTPQNLPLGIPFGMN